MLGGGARRRLLALTVVVAGCLVVPAAPPAVADDPPEPLRVLVVGDSVTQGSAGDFTWRYFLHQHLAAGGPVDLVGPRADLYDNVTSTPGSTAYADADFDRDHASRWGMTLAFPDWQIEDLVRDYRPDVVLELLGVNDLTFLTHSAERVADDLESFVADARSADPDVDVVLGQLSQTWYAKVDDLNDRLVDLAAELDDPDARVAVAELDPAYSQDDDTWDGAHPNARGDQLIAASFADALAGIGDGTPYPRPLAAVPIGPRTPPTVVATAGDGRVDLAWTDPPGASSERLHVRDVTAGGAWIEPAEPLTGGAWGMSGFVNGHVYGFSLQPVKGRAAAEPDAWSPELVVRPLPPVPGAVRLVDVVSPRRDVVRVIGTPVDGAASYRLEVAKVARCADPAPRFRRAVTGLATPRASYRTTAAAVRVRFVAVNVAGPGPAPRSRCVRVS